MRSRSSETPSSLRALACALGLAAAAACTSSGPGGDQVDSDVNDPWNLVEEAKPDCAHDPPRACGGAQCCSKAKPTCCPDDTCSDDPLCGGQCAESCGDGTCCPPEASTCCPDGTCATDSAGCSGDCSEACSDGTCCPSSEPHCCAAGGCSVDPC